MSPPPYMKLYIGDYLGDTHHLTTAEHGAYLLLLMSLWRAGGKLPRDDAKLAKLAKCTAEEWASIGPTVLEFFTVRGGVIVQKRASLEIAKYESVVKGASGAGKASAAKRANKNKPKASTDVEKTLNGNPTNQNQNQNQEDSPLQAPPTATVFQFRPAAPAEPAEPPKVEPKPKPPRRQPCQGATRLPADWSMGAEHLAYALDVGFDRQRAAAIAESFRDYWLSVPGAKGLKADWLATWRTWVRREAERNPPPEKQVEWC